MVDEERIAELVDVERAGVEYVFVRDVFPEGRAVELVAVARAEVVAVREEVVVVVAVERLDDGFKVRPTGAPFVRAELVEVDDVREVDATRESVDSGRRESLVERAPVVEVRDEGLALLSATELRVNVLPAVRLRDASERDDNERASPLLIRAFSIASREWEVEMERALAAPSFLRLKAISGCVVA